MRDTPQVDPVCLIHGKRWSEHEGGRCLFCCLCFDELTPEQCSRNEEGQLQDICFSCWAIELVLAASE